MIAKFWAKKPSVYAALGTWAASAFGMNPTLAAGFYHLFIVGPLLVLIIFLAHHEGKKS